MKHTAISLLFLVFIAAFDARAQSRNSNQCLHAGRAYQRLPLMADTPTEAEQQLPQHKAARQREQCLGRGRPDEGPCRAPNPNSEVQTSERCPAPGSGVPTSSPACGEASPLESGFVVTV